LLLKPLGETLYSVKLSGIPYALGSSIAVWLLARTLFDEGTALIAIVVYTFFAPALYIDTIAMLSVATTCAFGWAMYLLTRLFKSGKAADAYFAGIGCAGCYFLVHSGYIAFPLALFVFAMKWSDRSWKWSENARWFLTGFAATLAPFLAWALPSRLYFLRRFSEVSLLGSLSRVTPSVHSFRDFGFALSNQFAEVFLALFRAGIGGAGRYSFGHLAFFDPVTLVLLLLGLGAIGWRIRQRETILVILVLGLIGQFLAMALSDPPPAFHRFCGAHTLLCVVIALGLRAVQSMVTKFSRSRRAALVMGTLALVLFAVSSFSHFQRMIKIDGPEQSVRLGLYIAEKFPGRQIYIAGFPTLHLQRVFHFIPGVRIPPERQSIPEVFLRRLGSDPAATREKYLYVLLGPLRLYPMFKAADPHGSLVEFDNDHEYGLFVN
jgi:4-amino-4-deoxy-L-arabinose transferase-like glycosyltransferase